MSVATLSNRTVSVERATITQDASGGQVKAWAKVGRYKMRLQPRRGDDAIRHGKDESENLWIGYVSGSPDIRAGDRFPNPDDASRYLYVNSRQDSNMLAHHLRLELEERDQ
jgi:head-tail adaptor